MCTREEEREDSTWRGNEYEGKGGKEGNNKLYTVITRWTKIEVTRYLDMQEKDTPDLEEKRNYIGIGKGRR